MITIENIKLKNNVPLIASRLYNKLIRLTPEDLATTSLVVQLAYRENHSIFYLSKVRQLIFDEHFIEFEQENESTTYLKYDEILEYNVIRNDDLIEWELI